MRTGNLQESVLKRSVLKRIYKNKNFDKAEIINSAGIGVDCAVFSCEEKLQAMAVGVSAWNIQDQAYFAAVESINNLSAVAGKPTAITATLLFPQGAEEELLKEQMKQLEIVCRDNDICLVGGHTEVTPAVNWPIVSVNAIGSVEAGFKVQNKNNPGNMDIVMTKWAGIGGTVILAKEKEEILKNRFPDFLVNEAQSYMDYLCVSNEAKIAKDYAYLMHDISRGGVFGALWQLGEKAKVGMDIDLRSIPLKQFSVEICEELSLNPYELLGTGSLLVITDNGEALVEELLNNNIQATIIGRTNDSNDRILYNEEERRYLEPPKSDQLYANI